MKDGQARMLPQPQGKKVWAYSRGEHHHPHRTLPGDDVHHRPRHGPSTTARPEGGAPRSEAAGGAAELDEAATRVVEEKEAVAGPLVISSSSR